LDRLIAKGLKDKLVKIPFSSYPDLENAMERGELDGLIVDDTFVSTVPSDWVHLIGLTETQAWQDYLREFIGSDAVGVKAEEQIAIATVLEGAQSKSTLYLALQRALRSAEVKKQLLPDLCKTFWKNSSDVCTFAYGK
jgi:hypothetical protein